MNILQAIKRVLKKEWDAPVPFSAPNWWWIVMVALFLIYFLDKLGVV